MKKKLLCIILGMVLVLSVVPISAKAKPKLNHKTLYMSTADKVKLKVLNNKKKVKWSSSNKKVARVSKKGTVTPQWFGKTTITAKFGKKKLKCKVYVKEEDFWTDKYGEYSVSIMKISKSKKRIILRGEDINSGIMYAKTKGKTSKFKNAGKLKMTGYVKEYKNKCKFKATWRQGQYISKMTYTFDIKTENS